MRSSPAKIGYYGAAVALALASALAYNAIPDLPLAPQSDEPKKADFVLHGRQDFLQPLLLLQAVRLANLFARRPTSPRWSASGAPSPPCSAD